MPIYTSVTELVGNTPLVYLKQPAADGAGRVAVKLEYFNPLASVKDRIALSMIEAAEQDGSLQPGGTVVEATSGNTGIGLAFVCAARGYRLILTMPDTMSQERRSLLAVLGAELILTPGKEGMAGAVARAQQLVRETPAAFMPMQFNNPANPEAHERGTGPEIWRDSEGKVDILVAGVGTGGTITGAGRFLKQQKPSLQLVAVEPVGSPVLSGGEAGPHRIQGIGAGFVPEVLDQGGIDEVVQVEDEAAAETARRMCREEGIVTGLSGGANVWAARLVAARPENKGKLVVTFACDTGERYLSTWLYKQD